MKPGEGGEPPPAPPPAPRADFPPPAAAWTALDTVSGVIHTLSRRGKTRFILHDQAHDCPVECLPPAGMEEDLRRAWGRTARVEGIVRYNGATGAPETVPCVVSIVILPEAPARRPRSPKGALRSLGAEPRSEALVRRGRDGG